MELRENILAKVDSIVKERFDSKKVKKVPNINNRNLTLGNNGLEFSAAVLYIDIRESTKILDNHHNKTIAKIHMAYYYTIINIAKELNGEIRSFNGDSMLAFFPGTPKVAINNAVAAAMRITYMIIDKENGINKKLGNKYTEIDFGIGIDYGDILCTKIGITGGYNMRDLIWISHAVNKSTKLSDKAKYPNNIYISEKVYENLDSELQVREEERFFGLWTKTVSKWNKTSIEYNGEEERCYSTDERIEVE